MNTIMKTSMIIWFILSATIKMNAQYSDVHCNNILRVCRLHKLTIENIVQ